MQLDGVTGGRERDVPCAALQVVQEQVANLERWQTSQNGSLRSLAENVGALTVTHAKGVSDMQARIDAGINKVLLWCLGTLGFVLTIVGGLIVAHINKVI